MSQNLNEVLIHLDEELDESTLDALEAVIRQDDGVVSVGHRPRQKHLLMVVYDMAAVRGASLLHHFRDHGLHAQIIAM